MPTRQNRQALAPQPQPGYTIRKKARNWMVLDPQGQLVCLAVYKRGAVEVVAAAGGVSGTDPGEEGMPRVGIPSSRSR
jgi:hypothetical protein